MSAGVRFTTSWCLVTDMSDSYPHYKYDGNVGEYILLERPPKANLVMLREVEFHYRNMDTKEPMGTYTVIMDVTEDCRDGRIIREFPAWVYK